MKYIIWFTNLRLLILKNSLLKDRKTILRTLAIAVTIIIGQVTLSNIFNRAIFSHIAVSDEMFTGMLNIFFLIAVIWIYLISFVQSISSFARSFHQSPDMNYLISIPIPINQLFLYKFFEHLISSAKSMLLLFFPFLAALGIWAGLPLIYYIMIIPLYIVLSIIPCAVGVVVALVAFKLLPAKAFSLITTIATFAVNVFFALLFFRAENIAESSIVNLIEFLTEPWIVDILPITAGIKLFMFAAIGANATYATLFLLTISFLITTIAFLVAKKLYFEGWEKRQPVESKTGTKRVIRPNHDRPYNQNEIMLWIRTEWRMALRNQEMLISSAFMLFFFVFAIFTFIYGSFFSDNPMIGVSILITIAAIFNVMAVSILFIPANITKDKSLWKNRYWFLKSAPLSGAKVYKVQCVMYFVPSGIISIAGIIVYSAFVGLSLYLILFSILCTIIILFGSSAIYASVELISLSENFENSELMGNIMTVLFPVLYGLLSAGSVALFLAKDIVSEILLLSDISTFLSFPLVTITSIATIITTYILSRLLYVRVWEKMEI